MTVLEHASAPAQGMSDDALEIAAELRAVVKEVVVDTGGAAPARASLNGGRDDRPWRALGEVGLNGLTVAESHNGLGADLTSVLAAAEELGRVVSPAPFLTSAVMAGRALERCETATADELLQRLADGTATFAVLAQGSDGGWDAGDRTARPTADGYLLAGRQGVVIGAIGADLLLVVAEVGDADLGLFAVEATAAGVTVTALTSLDPTRPTARVEFVDAVASRVDDGSGYRAMLTYLRDQTLLTVAAESLGSSAACLDMALAYAKERVAFGRPIGGFQAIKHKLADLLIEVEFTRIAVERAANAKDDTELAVLAAVAIVQAAETAVTVSTENIHVHGGIGFTWEHDAHLHFRRARSTRVLFGPLEQHRERIAAHVIDPRPTVSGENHG